MTKGYAPAGSDRGVKRLGVTAVEARDVVAGPPTRRPVLPGPTMAVGQSQREALAALLESGSGSVDVVNGDGARLGILTLQALNAASRRSTDGTGGG